MELKEKIYPVLPEARNIANAPLREDNDSNIEVREYSTLRMVDSGKSFRLNKISEIQKFLENEIKVREQLAKIYLKISKVADNVDAGLIVVALAAGGGGLALLSTVVAIPATIALEISALVTGVVALVGKFMVRRTRTKSEKHLQIKMIADSKLNTIVNHISKAIADNEIEHSEFTLIMDELEKYKLMKEEIRTKSNKKSKLEEKESLIERGKQEAREEFRRLVEKRHGGSLPY